MNILVVHNYYIQPGGEDTSFRANVMAIERLGHHVVTFTADNDSISSMGRIDLAIKTVWNKDIAREIYDLCIEHHIQVAFFHNTFPLISPAAYSAVRAAGGKVVQWLHNYRSLCPSATFFRDGRICENCLHEPVPLSSIIHRCYHDSFAASGVTAGMISYHRLRRTWINEVDRFIALTKFARDKYIVGGLPAHKIIVMGNFLQEDPGIGSGDGGYALFVGRLSPEKGVETLLHAWQTLGPSVPLKIAGDGPLQKMVVEACRNNSKIEWMGHLLKRKVIETMKDASCLIFPSECYESFGLTVVEAFSVGTPVIAAMVGSMGDLIYDGVTGLHFKVGDHEDLTRAVLQFLEMQQNEMRKAARQSFLDSFTIEVGTHNLEALLYELGNM